jgi:transcriptional regulator with XRE-family HTH domain
VSQSSTRTIDLYFEETGLGVEDVAAKSGLSPDRVEAIALGRWTPSPAERKKIAATFGVDVTMVSWGHTMDPRNVRYRRYGLKEDF